MLVAHLLQIDDRSELDHLLNQAVRIEQVAVEQLTGQHAHFAVEIVGGLGGQNASA